MSTTTPPAPTTYPEPATMAVDELCSYHKFYSARVYAHLVGVGHDQSEAEKAHAHAVGVEYGEWRRAMGHPIYV